MVRVLTVCLVLCGLSAPLHAWVPIKFLPSSQQEEGGDADARVIPFTTFALEQQAIGDGLPCKWVSTGKGPSASYDFLCKGGTWATVSLMLDKAPTVTDGISRVRLIFREWPEAVHPGGGEAYVAQQFLQHVVGHFVPAPLSREVGEAFWASRDRKWRTGAGVDIGYTFERKRDFVLRRLELVGDAGRLSGKAAERAVTVTPTEAGLGTSEQPDATKAPLPVLKRPDAPQPVKETQAPADVLQEANPAELHTQPDPVSKMKPTAPEPISDTLVPEVDEMIRGRGKAPTNFDVYNKAQELTEDVEAKVLEESRKDSKIQAPDPQGEKAPPVKSLPTPALDVETSPPLETPSDRWPEGEGLGTPSTPAIDPADPRFNPTRSLPQLKFIPKAVPLEKPDEVIQFEDEASGL